MTNDNSSEIDSLSVICMRRASIIFPAETISSILPSQIGSRVLTFRSDINSLREVILTRLPVQDIPEKCFVAEKSGHLDFRRSILSMEKYISPLEFFDCCSRYALDEPTERLFPLLQNNERYELLERNAASKCRVMELSHIDPDIPYDEVALDCASRGYLQPLERSLMKINILDDTLLPKCVLRAILNGHYDIANHIVCDNFDRAFYSVFPDGRVPAEFFATLIDSDKVSQGDQIATSLLRYLPKLDVQRLRRMIERDRTVSRSALMMLDGMYSEITDNREYPCDYD